MHRAIRPGRSRRFVEITASEPRVMTSAQEAAFQAGSGVPASVLITGFAAVVLTLALVWGMWVTLGSFRAWQDGQLALFDLVWMTVRAGIVLLVLGFYLR